MRSWAFSFLAGLSSVFARSAYESRVREKEVRDAEIWPSSDGVSGVPDGAERSRLRDVDCLRAVLKRVFCNRGHIDELGAPMHSDKGSLP